MCNKQRYVCCVLFVTLVVAAIATGFVLSLASESSDSDSDSSVTADIGPPQHFHQNMYTSSTNSANIVLIILDDAGWADFSYNNKDPWSALETPNIDKILSDGLSFSNYYTQALCTPARGSLMTGRWTYVLGLQHLMVLRTCVNARLSWDIPTWGELLKEKDYNNYWFGKWHLGMDSWKSTPRGRGWDSFVGSLNSDHGSAGGSMNGKGVWVSLNDDWDCDLSMADQVLETRSNSECMFRSYDYRYAEYNPDTSKCYSFVKSTLETACADLNTEDIDYNDDYILRGGSFLHLDLDEHSVDWWRDYDAANPYFTKHGDIILTDEAVTKLEEISANEDEKWSVMLSYKTPHQDTSFVPYGTNTPIVAACERFFDESSIYYNYDRGAICQQMWQIDVQIGRIVTALEDLKLWDNTLVMFTNDNGGTSSQYDDATTVELNYNYGLNWPLRGVKSSYYEGAVKTIMGITGGALPDSQRGVVNSDLHHISDITPTILAAAGFSDEDMVALSNGENFDGIPLFSTPTASSRGHEYVFLSAPSFTGEEKWDNNITAIVLESGKKQVQVSVGDELNSVGYWGTLPTWETIESTWETCDDGCVWDLVEDPYEHINLAPGEDQQPFIDLLEEAMTSDSWNDGLTFDRASCEDCSLYSVCDEDSGVYYFGYLFYPPWSNDI